MAIMHTAYPVHCDSTVPRAIPSIFMPKPNTKVALRAILTTFVRTENIIGSLVSCMPMSQPVAEYIPRTAGAPQTTIPK